MVKFEGIELPSGKKMKSGEIKDYKYLEFNDLMHEGMRILLKRKYFSDQRNYQTLSLVEKLL